MDPLQNILTPEEESQMDLITNAIIDRLLADQDKTTKTPLPYPEKGTNLIVKGDVKI